MADCDRVRQVLSNVEQGRLRHLSERRSPRLPLLRASSYRQRCSIWSRSLASEQPYGVLGWTQKHQSEGDDVE
jgi:hypothetical protein